MKAIVFAGGTGTRLWPLSRKKSPKQFEKIIEGKSTLQIMVSLVSTVAKPSDIYISTNKLYVKNIKKQVPQLPEKNIIAEPIKKDTAAAVSFALSVLAEKNPKEPVVIVWGDHVLKKPKNFTRVLKKAEKIIEKEPSTLIFIGQKPKYAATMLGWIKAGKIIDPNEPKLYAFERFVEKPDKKLAEKYLKDGSYAWNVGYFVTTPSYMLSLFKKYAPEIYELAQEAAKERKNSAKLKKIFEKMPEISVDYAVLEKLPKSSGFVLVEDLGWIDVGAWETLKSALEEKSEDNVISGDVFLEDCKDTLIYNFAKNKLIVAVDLEDIVIVDAEDALLVAKKSSASKIKKVVKMLSQSEYEKLT